MKDEEIRHARLSELALRAKYNDGIEISTFFSYSEIAAAEKALGKKFVAASRLFGGYPEAERRVFLFSPSDAMDELELEQFAEANIGCYLLERKTKDYAEDFTHSSVLGSLMGLGIKREMLGDILVDGKRALFFALTKIERELASLGSVGRDEIVLSRIRYEQAPIKARFEIRTISYESNRLDAIVAECFRLSREKAKSAIASGEVFLTSASEPKADTKVQEGDHISMKGKGKVIFMEEVGTSRKGKTVAQIKMPI